MGQQHLHRLLRRQAFVAGLVSGLVLTSIGAIITAWWAGLEQFTKHETIVAGLLAIVGGSIPVYFIYRQIVTATQIAAAERADAERLRLSQGIRARAMLSLPLVEVSEYALQSLQLLDQHYEWLPGGGVGAVARRVVPTPTPLPAPFPAEAIAQIGDAIGSVEDGPARQLAILLSKVQVQNSRIRDTMQTIYSPSARRMIFTQDLDQYSIDSIEILALVSCVFPFSRFDSEQIGEPTSDDLRREARIAHVQESRHSTIYETIRRRWSSGETLTSVRSHEPISSR